MLNVEEQPPFNTFRLPNLYYILIIWQMLLSKATHRKTQNPEAIQVGPVLIK